MVHRDLHGRAWKENYISQPSEDKTSMLQETLKKCEKIISEVTNAQRIIIDDKMKKDRQYKIN